MEDHSTSPPTGLDAPSTRLTRSTATHGWPPPAPQPDRASAPSALDLDFAHPSRKHTLAGAPPGHLPTEGADGPSLLPVDPLEGAAASNHQLPSDPSRVEAVLGPLLEPDDVACYLGVPTGSWPTGATKGEAPPSFESAASSATESRTSRRGWSHT